MPSRTFSDLGTTDVHYHDASESGYSELTAYRTGVNRYYTAGLLLPIRFNLMKLWWF